MANQLFETLNKQYQMSNQEQRISQSFNEFSQNPIMFLAKNNINVPNAYANNPKGLVQYYLSNGIMSQKQYNDLMSMAQKCGINLT